MNKQERNKAKESIKKSIEETKTFQTLKSNKANISRKRNWSRGWMPLTIKV